jgi:lipopolysaccharide export system protein LptA
MRGIGRIATLLLLLLAGGFPLFAQQKKAPKDSLFRLIQADRAEQYERFGMQYRLVQGHARFLHNDTYLLCDSASWNVDAKFIEAFGNVQLIQNKTMLKSEEMQYWIDESRAQFRGQIVELIDKDGNTLRTDRLTYNTQDSVAVFEYGGALKDKDGGIIEGRKGTYDGKEGLFSFEERTELFLDSIEVKTQSMRYLSEEGKAYFGRNTYVWRGNGFLRADAGWYDRANQMIHFSDHVFMFDPSYDAWSDMLYYNQATGAVDLYQNAQVLDTVNKSVYLGDHLQYLPATDSLSQRGLLTGDPAIVYYGENENHVVDTLYARADTFYVYAVPRCDVPKEEVSAAERRLEDMLYDALTAKRTEEAEAREKDRIEKMRQVGKLPPEWVERAKQAEADSLAALARLDSLVTAGAVDSLVAAEKSLRASRTSVDSLINAVLHPVIEEPDDKDDTPDAPDAVRDSSSVVRDSTAVIPGLTGNPADSTAVMPADSTAVIPVDSTAVTRPPRDTTPIRYVLAWNNVKMYRSDMQAACDSMVFSELDSIARLYGEPVLWNEVRNQLTADEMQLLMKDGTFSRGSMLTNAWIISRQDSVHFNQIKSTEMLGYFHDSKLYRFDALGGVSAIFYMADEDVITTVNLKESRSLTAALKDGQAQRLLYMESIKSDAYPVGEVEPEKQRLKGFVWRGEERPVSRETITAREVRTSERKQYEHMQRPLFRETNKYFDNYMNDLIERRNEERRAEAARRQAEKDSLDRLAYLAQVEQQAIADSLAAVARRDSLIAAGFPLDSAGNPIYALDSLGNLVPAVIPVTPGDTTTVIPGLTGNLNGAPGNLPDSTAIAPKENVILPQPDPTRPTRSRRDSAAVVSGQAGDVTPASPETVIKTENLTRAEKRALRRAERKARREARRAARLARRLSRRDSASND